MGVVGRHVARLGSGALLATAVHGGSTNAAAGFGRPGDVPLDGLEDPTPSALDVDGRATGTPSGAEDVEGGPALRYGRLSRDACEAELATRGVSFTRVDGARGVLAPIRLTGDLRGVSFHSGLPAAQRASSPWDIVDCRLALALDDFAVQLSAHDIVDVLHYSIYRPPGAGWPRDRVASRHPGALAIDAASFTKRDGSKLDVERDFHGRIGAVPCGPGAGPNPATAESIEIRQIICEAAQARLFNVALTPDFNWAHRNHFHLEVAAGLKWFTVR